MDQGGLKMLAVFPYVLIFVAALFLIAGILLLFPRIRNSRFITGYTIELDKDSECKTTVSQLVKKKKAINKDIGDKGKELDSAEKQIRSDRNILDKTK